MKIRAIKARHTRRNLAAVPRSFKFRGRPVFITNAAPTIVKFKETLFPVFRKKDNELVDTVTSEAAATALVLKAKASKKASLYIGTPYTA